MIFNSRIETIKEKPYWKNLFNKNRCLIPATAFYEWKTEDKVKIPQRISFDNMPLFFIAGIYVTIGDGIFASMITTNPNTTIAKIHNRMPVIMNKDEGLRYLSLNADEALKLCIPLDDNVNTEVKIAEEILTEKQREFLNKN